MVDSGRKNVIVVLDTKGDEDSDDNFEIGFSNENGTFSDLALITQKLIAKSETVRNSVRDRDLVLKRQSNIKEGLWVVMGEDSPVKSGSIIKCSFKTPAQMSLRSATKESTVLVPSTMTVVAPGTSHDGFLEEFAVTRASTPHAEHDNSVVLEEYVDGHVSTLDISHGIVVGNPYSLHTSDSLNEDFVSYNSDDTSTYTHSTDDQQNDLTYKLKRIMERRRTEVRSSDVSAKHKSMKLNGNDSGPTKYPSMAMDNSDTISYGKNVAKMLEISKNGTAPCSTAVDNLVKLTFSIRRIRVMKWIPESGRIEKFIDSHCPFLKHQTFLFFEFELIMKKPCEIFREMWTQSAKFIIEAAKTTNKKQVASLLSSKPFQNMSPEMCSRAALELLPFLVPGKGRGDKAA
ncbi:uncharacterized protein LOC130700631 isoform X2 [Daphnia carinata]|uniref:uncharacterized protein LOC130700631 isoform X2 n=1 Tax=Daphnia carinata TaxID=120202 RepID=UPI00257E677D|nr:uncharacterized protein LOC130700631 isoform X2 [Daphnia carinata]